MPHRAGNIAEIAPTGRLARAAAQSGQMETTKWILLRAAKGAGSPMPALQEKNLLPSALKGAAAEPKCICAVTGGLSAQLVFLRAFRALAARFCAAAARAAGRERRAQCRASSASSRALSGSDIKLRTWVSPLLRV